ncbi:MAG: hypothetical protein LBT98_03450 [Puniceicoccales bacterium]|jgi:hypothetical protein|nr:hypothetical protein [Puniceicoccales bacterium]
MMCLKKAQKGRKSRIKKVPDGKGEESNQEHKMTTITIDELFEMMKRHVLGKPPQAPETERRIANERNSNGTGN